MNPSSSIANLQEDFTVTSLVKFDPPPGYRKDRLKLNKSVIVVINKCFFIAVVVVIILFYFFLFPFG